MQEQDGKGTGADRQCQGLTKAGARCLFPALLDGSGHCFVHSPTTAAQRRAASRKGGLRTAQKRSALVGQIDFESPEGIRSFLEGLTVAAITEAIPSGRARDVAAIAEVALRVRAGAEAEARLDAIETALQRLVEKRSAQDGGSAQ